MNRKGFTVSFKQVCGPFIKVVCFLQYIDCTRPLDSIVDELGFECIRQSAAYDIDHCNRKHDDMECFVDKWF